MSIMVRDVAQTNVTATTHVAVSVMNDTNGKHSYNAKATTNLNLIGMDFLCFYSYNASTNYTCGDYCALTIHVHHHCSNSSDIDNASGLWYQKTQKNKRFELYTHVKGTDLINGQTGAGFI